MALLRLLMLVIGVLAVLCGLLFILQGLGIVRWPHTSFMIDDRSWSVRGALLVAGGALMAIYGRSLRR